MDKFRKNPKFWRFPGQFDLKDEGKFEGIIQNTSKVSAFTKNHTDDDDDGTKTRPTGLMLTCYTL